MNTEQQPRNQKGRFAQSGAEPKGEPISLRLPRSLDSQLRQVAGADYKQWIQTAIAEKLKQENDQNTV